jgi:hypothetical protein
MARVGTVRSRSAAGAVALSLDSRNEAPPAMLRLRLAALLAAPAMLMLAACGGNGSNVIGTGVSAQDAQVRFLAAAPDIASFDYRFWPSSGTRPTNAAATNFPYGQITTFAGYSVGTYNLEVDQPGTSTTDLPVCSIPTLNGGQNYTIVVAGTGSTHTCLVYNDAVFTNTGATRLHHASPALNAAGTSTIVWGAAAGAVPSTSLVAAAQFPTSAANVQPTIAVGDVTGTPVTYSVGPSPSGTNPLAGATFTPTYTLTSTNFLVGTGPSQPDTSGVVPYSTYPGTSLFAIDCITTAPAGASPCVAGTTVLGVFDNK